MVQDITETRTSLDEEYVIMPDRNEVSTRVPDPVSQEFYRLSIHMMDGSCIVRDFKEKQTAFSVKKNLNLFGVKKSGSFINLPGFDTRFSINPDYVMHISVTPETIDPIIDYNYRILKRTPCNSLTSRIQATVIKRE